MPKPKPAWEALGPSPSLGERRGLAHRGVAAFPLRKGECLPAYLPLDCYLLGETLLLESLVIFPSFLLMKF